MKLLGLHHITAIAADARRNVGFYTDVLGLRLVKKTVNFDDPSTYHLYYGDTVGTPGSIMTFFPWAGLRRGRPGNGQAYATAFSVSAGSLRFWEARLLAHGIHPTAAKRFRDDVLTFTDPDGLIIEIIVTADPDSRTGWTHPEVPAAMALRGFHSITLAVIDVPRTRDFMTGMMGYRVLENEGGRTRLTVADATPGTFVDLWTDSTIPRGLSGAGTVHHVAFRTADDAGQLTALAELEAKGLHVSPVMDRNYFNSIYYREPEGVLFEIATDTPGFAIDEAPDRLGTVLQLPAQYEAQRAEIEGALPALT